MRVYLKKTSIIALYGTIFLLAVISFVGASLAIEDDLHAGHKHGKIEKSEEKTEHEHGSECSEEDLDADKDEHAECDHEAEDTDEHEGHDHGSEEGVIHIGLQGVREAGIVVSRVGKGSLKSDLSLPGTVQPHPDGEGLVGTLVEGRVKELFADFGDQVEEGQALCLVESPTVGEAEAAYSISMAEYTFISNDHKRHQQLVEEGIGSQKEVLELKMKLEMIKNTVNSAKNTMLALGFSGSDIEKLNSGQQSGGVVTLRSPISGAVISREARLGMKVNPDMDLFHIVDNRRLRVEVDIPEREIHDIIPGMKAEVSSLSGSGRVLSGSIERIAGEISAETRTVTAFVDVRNLHGHLLPGAYVNVRIDMEKGVGDVILIPIESVVRDENGDKLVYVEIEPGGYSPREIITGYSRGGWIEIYDGLTVGERIVAEGAFAIKSEAGKSNFHSGCSH